MGRWWFGIGTAAFLLMTLVVVPRVFGIPEAALYTSDDADYSAGAVHILEQGFYSVDGVTPYANREPGESVLMAIVFRIFGIRTHLGLYAAHAFLFFIAAGIFCQVIAEIFNRRVGGMTFLLLLTSGSTLHAIFSGYRECLALSILLVFSALLLGSRERTSIITSHIMGFLLGFLILTYYPFILLPAVLLVVWILEDRPWGYLAAMLAIAGTIVGLWAYRNYVADGQARIIDARRSNVMWFVRGEQAVNIHGREAFECLWSEYISRDWTGRSPSCNFNAVMHRRWPSGFEDTADLAAAGKAGKALILQNLPSYLWFSVFEVLELHLPYVGGGWSRTFNLFAAVTQGILLVGCLFALPSLLLDKRYRFLVLLMLYTTGMFALTDALPRYLVPIIFCYALFAAVGYDHVLHFLSLCLSRIRSLFRH